MRAASAHITTIKIERWMRKPRNGGFVNLSSCGSDLVLFGIRMLSAFFANYRLRVIEKRVGYYGACMSAS